MAKILEIGETLSLPCIEPIHLKTGVTNTTHGVFVETNFHQPQQCTLAKFLHGLLPTSLHRSDSAGQRIEIPSANGRQLVAVRIDRNEEACVSLKHLIGFSDTAQFRTVMDWSATAFAIGRSFLHLASGPATLVFRCSGKPSSWTERTTQRIQSNRLVFWPKDSVFSSSPLTSDFDIWFGQTRMFVSSQTHGGVIIADVDESSVEVHPLLGLIKQVYRV